MLLKCSVSRCQTDPASRGEEAKSIPEGVNVKIILEGDHYARFRADLLAHRDKFPLNDADYVDQVLKISLNTFKKCVNAAGHLALTRPTFLHIFVSTGLNPKDYGLAMGLPTEGSLYGGYEKREFSFICGRFFLYRRSFLTASNINKSVLDIYANSMKECLSFVEYLCYTSDSGASHEQIYHGDIHIDLDRVTLSFLALLAGQVRLTLVSMPPRASGKEPIKLRGALLTHGIARGFWQPTVSCVFADGHHDTKQGTPRDLCGTIRPNSEEFQRISAELVHAEENATVITPLMWHRLKDQRGSSQHRAPEGS